MFDELESVREQEYAFNSEEHVEGYYGVAVPVRTEDEVLGALAISGPVKRVRNEEFRTQLVQALSEAVNELELELKFHEA